MSDDVVEAVAAELRKESERADDIESDLFIWKNAAKKQQARAEAAERIIRDMPMAIEKAAALELALKRKESERADTWEWAVGCKDKQLAELFEHGQTLSALVEAEKKRNAALEMALQRYGKHEPHCSGVQSELGCACGLTDALADYSGALDIALRQAREAALLEAGAAIRAKRESTKDWMSTTRDTLWDAEVIVRELAEGK